MKESVNRFTLIENDEFLKCEIESEEPCFLCGNKIKFCGFDFYLENVSEFICKKCAAIHAPDLVEIQENALFHAKVVTGRERNHIMAKLTEAMKDVFGEVKNGISNR
jgi:hypothetical protein